MGVGNRYAISDIHGCGNTFIELLNTISLTKDDTLYILGDSINRGKRSKKTIKTIISLLEQGYSIVPIRGNHEQFIIAALEYKELEDFIKICKRMKLKWLIDESIENNIQIKEKYISFFKQMPFYINLDTILLSHAGFDFTKENMFENTYAMLNQRASENVEDIPDNIRVFHGHTPISLQKIRRSIDSGSQIINIDNGCVYNTLDAHWGNLICINIDSLAINIQKNIDV
jgi:serine/threonine protein phosphatase 1